MAKQGSSLDDGSLNIAFFSVLVVALLLLFVFSEGEAIPKEGEEKIAVLSSLDQTIEESSNKKNIILTDDTLLYSTSSPFYEEPPVLMVIEEEEKEKSIRRWVRLTAYAPLDPNAQEGMCFSGNPSITALGTLPRDGVVAANFLPFGTKIKIPSLFGDKVFTVEDRMSSRFQNTVDIVVSSQREARSFGVKSAYIEILK